MIVWKLNNQNCSVLYAHTCKQFLNVHDYLGLDVIFACLFSIFCIFSIMLDHYTGYASAVYAVIVCPSVCPSVTSWHCTKWLNVGSRKQSSMIAHGL